MSNKNKTVPKSIKNPEILKKKYKEMLEYWPVKKEEKYIPTSFGKTFCIKSGDASNPPMILIHGAQSNSASWMGDIKVLNEKYCTFCLDIPGDPGGSEDKRFGWEGSCFSDWIGECMDLLGVETAAIGGLSLGGWASIRFAIDYPGRADKLLLLAPAGIAPVKLFPVLKLVLFSMMGEWGKEKIIKMLFKGREVTRGIRDFIDVTSNNCKPRLGNPPVFSDEELASLKIPVVLIGAEEDAIIDTKKTAERLKHCVSNFKSVLLDEGHALVNLDKKVFDLLG